MMGPLVTLSNQSPDFRSKKKNLPMPSMDTKLSTLLEWVKNTQDETLSPSRHTYISPKFEVRELLGSGRGLYSRSAINTKEQVLRIPHSFLLNKTTVIRHISRFNKKITLTDPSFLQIYVPYNAHNDNITDIYAKFSLEELMAMSSFQIISMYLVLELQRGKNSFWWPFIDSLPEITDFSLTPLLWQVLEVDEHTTLMDHLPPSTRKMATKIYERFTSDYEVVQKALASKTDSQMLSLKTYLWAWLSINSRCLYMDIPLLITREDNFTMAPYVDFLNHSPDDHCNLKIDATGFHVFTTCKYLEDEQLYLSYGPHSNEFLLCEYGFALHGDNKWNELDLTDTILPLFDAKQIEFLKENDYYGDYTVSFESGPSFRTEVALATLQEPAPAESQRLRALINGILDPSAYAKSSSVLLREMMLKVCHQCDSKLAFEYNTHENTYTRERFKTIGVLYKNMKQIAEKVLSSLDR